MLNYIMTLPYFLSVFLLSLLGFFALGSLLNLSSHPHWFVRGWDFPRVQIIVAGWLLVASYFVLRLIAGGGSVVGYGPMLATVLLLSLWHGFRIMPYTVLMPKQSASTPAALMTRYDEDPKSFRIVMTNVEMENDQYQRWMEEMRRVDPDLLLVLEVDETWMSRIHEFRKLYPYEVSEPNDNWYGMLLLSKLPIVDHTIRCLVQEDVPSIDAEIQMDSGQSFRFVGVHPRPPEPIRDNHATARDAELTLWGRELENEKGAVVIGGDLNDVAWSQTTRLFLRTSGLLDPRRGRGFYNTFHADHWYMRFPLDHIFHSPHFTISRLERLGFVGSDHFPILIDLRYTPSQKSAHRVLDSKSTDEEESDLRIGRAVHDDDLQGEAVDENPREAIEP